MNKPIVSASFWRGILAVSALMLAALVVALLIVAVTR